jgi:hypothetical protein
MNTSTESRFGDDAPSSYLFICLHTDDDQSITLRSVYDTKFKWTTKSPRFIPEIDGGRSHKLYIVLLECFEQWEKDSDGNAFLNGSNNTSIVLSCENDGIIVRTVSTTKQNGVEVLVDQHHPRFNCTLLLFEAMRASNASDFSRNADIVHRFDDLTTQLSTFEENMMEV